MSVLIVPVKAFDPEKSCIGQWMAHQRQVCRSYGLSAASEVMRHQHRELFNPTTRQSRYVHPQ